MNSLMDNVFTKEKLSDAGWDYYSIHVGEELYVFDFDVDAHSLKKKIK